MFLIGHNFVLSSLSRSPIARSHSQNRAECSEITNPSAPGEDVFSLPPDQRNRTSRQGGSERLPSPSGRGKG
jgi:hypothetical protein